MGLAAAGLVLTAGPASAQISLLNVARTNNGGNAFGLAISSNRLYLANYDDGLRIYDVSNPTNPVVRGHTNNGGFASGLAVVGNRLYLANSDDGLRVYDVSNATNPVSIGHVVTGAAALAVAVAGNLAYVANNDDGLRVYDISNPSNIVNVGHGANPGGGNAFGVTVAEGFAFVANNLDGVRIYNVANPSNCVSVAVINDGGLAFAATISGNQMYYANGFDGLRIYDISNPSIPSFRGHASIPGGSAFGIAIAPPAGIVYMANFEDGLFAYDVLNPLQPAQITSVNNGGTAHGVALAGSYVYLANGEDGLRVYLAIPQLNIKAPGGSPVVLSWRGPATEFELQESTNPAGPNWAAVSSVPSFIASQNQVTVPVPTGARYYRLRYVGARGPGMSIAKTGTNSAAIAWSAAFAGFALQQNTNLATTNWTAVTNVASQVSGLNQVTVSPLPGNRFFRLKGQ
jgi:hypothetical protein